ncbi:hypothetical protein ACOMCU_16100 [Lysinibacillus sp. UGB7]|uniref:hypothetical protein n=1 Tax=Lysinibacillus sp. UGB7 TaxID=3411039 RepID=UPI003B77DF1C
MTMFLLEGDNDPHLPKLSQHGIASFMPAYLSTVEETSKKYVRLKGKSKDGNYKDILQNRLNRYIGKRMCLFSDYEKYFLKEAILTKFLIENNEYILLFEVDELTYRNDDYFKRDPYDSAIERFEEINEELKTRYDDLQEVVEHLETIQENISTLHTPEIDSELDWNEIQTLRGLIFAKLDTNLDELTIKTLNSALEKLSKLGFIKKMQMETE